MSQSEKRSRSTSFPRSRRKGFHVPPELPPASSEQLARLTPQNKTQVKTSSTPELRDIELHAVGFEPEKRLTIDNFVDVVKSYVSYRIDPKYGNQTFSSQVTFLRNLRTALTRQSIFVLSRESSARLDALLSDMELNASREESDAQPFVRITTLERAVDLIRRPGIRDSLKLMLALPHRMQDNKEKIVYSFYDEGLEIRTTTTKTIRSQAEARTILIPREHVYCFETLRSTLAEYDRIRPKDSTAIINEAPLSGKTKGKVGPITTAMADKALRDVSTILGLDRALTTYNFRLHYMMRTIERFRLPSGVVDYDSVKQHTLHFDVASLQACYYRVGVRNELLADIALMTKTGKLGK